MSAETTDPGAIRCLSAWNHGNDDIWKLSVVLFPAVEGSGVHAFRLGDRCKAHEPVLNGV
jgi:hypothetical protein